jgi:hypothetical protein
MLTRFQFKQSSFNSIEEKTYNEDKTIFSLFEMKFFLNKIIEN